jgi:ribosomal protein L32
MPLTNFVRNYQDLSTDTGFQYEFFCDRCGNGYQTQFEPSVISGVTDILDTAGSLLGGFLSGAASIGEKVRSATWKKAHDTSFQKAIAEARPHFKQCTRCGQWMDNICWNHSRGMCKGCTPDLEEEFSNIQAQAAIEQATYVKAEKFQATIVVNCSQCGASLQGGKFCAECGTPVKQPSKCHECGSDTQGGKFCPECGIQQ